MTSKLITLVRLLDLCVDPRFRGRCLFTSAGQHPFKDAATVNFHFVGVGWQHQINLCFNFLIAKHVNIYRLRAAQWHAICLEWKPFFRNGREYALSGLGYR